MIAAIDIGNTHIECGVFKDNNQLDLVTSFRIGTNKNTTTDEIALKFCNLFALNKIEYSEIKNAIFVSVVPPLNHNITKMMYKYFKLDIIQFTKELIPDIPIQYDNPSSVGGDRLVNAKAVKELYGTPSIIIDYGTATTIDIINQKNEYLGGMIIPGISISMEALFEKTSMLPKIELALPTSFIGKSTIESMQNGIYYINSFGINGIISSLKKDYFPHNKCSVISTGGLGNFISQQTKVIDKVDDKLTLKGLKIIYDEKKWQKK